MPSTAAENGDGANLNAALFAPECASAAVLVQSESMPGDAPTVQGHDFAKHGRDFDKLFENMKTMGFQATNLARAIEEVEKMVRNDSKHTHTHTHTQSGL